MLNELHSGRN